jgi:hypothetical protein
MVLLSAGAASCVLLVALCFGWRAFSKNPSAVVPPARASLPNLGICLTAKLSGTIRCTSRGVVSPDGGARVLAWPADLRPDPKFSAAEAAADSGCLHVLPTDGLYRGRAGQDGRYSFPVHALGEFSILIVSATASRKTPISEYDLAALADCFEHPQELLGQSAYSLTRCSIASKKPVVVDWQFESDGTR